MTPARKPHLTLVQKRTANEAVDTRDDDERKFLEDLRGLLWARGGAIEGRGWKGLSEKARLADRTIARFASGETKRPTLFTVRRIFHALDCKMVIELPPEPKPRKKA